MIPSPNKWWPFAWSCSAETGKNMVYIIVRVFVVAAIVIFPLIRWSWIGNRTGNAPANGQFDQTPLEK